MLEKHHSRHGYAKMRMELKGVHTVKIKHPDGRSTTYVYAWRGGPRIKARVGTPEFVAEYNRLVAARKTPITGTFFGLIAAYKASSSFTKRADKTRKDYLRYLRMIEDRFGTLPISALEDKALRGVFKKWRDQFADTPRKADYAWTMLARVLAHAKDAGSIAVNVCERGGRLYEADRSEKVWTAADIEAMALAASPELGLAMLMGLWTGQREGDLLALPWSAYDGKKIRLRQRKTGKRVVIPVGYILREALDAMSRPSAFGCILLNTRGKAWTEDGFRTSWGKAADRAQIEGLTFNDLRGTAVTRLALAECSVPQIATITGHSLKDVEAILDAHYLGRDVRLAEEAIKKLERKERRTRSVKNGVK